ncbi:family 2 glycosyl transferase [Pedobacter sp. KBW06]|uniref:glycosyltransferase n=1 Tax=Pedobacter sp. KBW06 TaxID=2153359 RepID=UPI000F5A7D99|nr:glycosyltransferase [Pedobacter sp. KBW06]RQO75587.1 family 2 glycosyl transferase [Pedobacter sp. KBW06]
MLGEYKVCILIVTYGNRWHLIEQVLKQVLIFEQVTDIVVVNNASCYNVSECTARMGDGRLTVLNNSENLGSAGGYKQGITYIHKKNEADFYWLLDDDNVPEENTMSTLLDIWDEIPGNGGKKALFCLRDDRTPHVKIAKGEDYSRYYLIKDNFMGFSISNSLPNKYYKLQDMRKDTREYKRYVQIPYVPYGGLLLHKLMIEVIGLPNTDYFLYADDSEYTYRITQNNGTIWLVPSCKIIDVDKSQGFLYKKKVFHSYLLDQWSFRTYFTVRNLVYFHSCVAIQNKVMFQINKILFLAYLKVISILSSRTKQYKKLRSAVDDGLNGRLGKGASSSWDCNNNIDS